MPSRGRSRRILDRSDPVEREEGVSWTTRWRTAPLRCRASRPASPSACSWRSRRQASARGSGAPRPASCSGATAPPRSQACRRGAATPMSSRSMTWPPWSCPRTSSACAPSCCGSPTPASATAATAASGCASASGAPATAQSASCAWRAACWPARMARPTACSVRSPTSPTPRRATTSGSGCSRRQWPPAMPPKPPAASWSRCSHACTMPCSASTATSA